MKGITKSNSAEINLAKAKGHPLRVRIMQAIVDGLAASPNTLAVLLEEPLGNVSYHVKTLLELGCLELAKTEPRRGAVEHFYRSTGTWSPGRECILTEAQRRSAAAAIEQALEVADMPAAAASIPEWETLQDFLLEGLLDPVPA